MQETVNRWMIVNLQEKKKMNMWIRSGMQVEAANEQDFRLSFAFLLRIKRYVYLNKIHFFGLLVHIDAK